MASFQPVVQHDQAEGTNHIFETSPHMIVKPAWSCLSARFVAISWRVDPMAPCLLARVSGAGPLGVVGLAFGAMCLSLHEWDPNAVVSSILGCN